MPTYGQFLRLISSAYSVVLPPPVPPTSLDLEPQAPNASGDRPGPPFDLSLLHVFACSTWAHPIGVCLARWGTATATFVRGWAADVQRKLQLLVVDAIQRSSTPPLYSRSLNFLDRVLAESVPLFSRLMPTNRMLTALSSTIGDVATELGASCGTPIGVRALTAGAELLAEHFRDDFAMFAFKVSPFLSDQNAECVALALCRMRGATLKVLAALDIVRQRADVMPSKQLNSVLDAELGQGWSSRLRSFNYQPGCSEYWTGPWSSIEGWVRCCDENTLSWGCGQYRNHLVKLCILNPLTGVIPVHSKHGTSRLSFIAEKLIYLVPDLRLKLFSAHSGFFFSHQYQ